MKDKTDDIKHGSGGVVGGLLNDVASILKGLLGDITGLLSDISRLLN